MCFSPFFFEGDSLRRRTISPSILNWTKRSLKVNQSAQNTNTPIRTYVQMTSFKDVRWVLSQPSAEKKSLISPFFIGETLGESPPRSKYKVSSGRIRTTPNKSVYSNQNIIIHETFVSPERNLHIIGMNTTFAGLFSNSE